MIYLLIGGVINLCDRPLDGFTQVQYYFKSTMALNETDLLNCEKP